MQTERLPNYERTPENLKSRHQSYDPENDWESHDPSEEWDPSGLSTVVEHLESMSVEANPHEIFEEGRYVRLETGGEKVVEGMIDTLVEEAGSDRYFLEIDTADNMNKGLKVNEYVVPFKIESSDFDISENGRTEIFIGDSEVELARLKPGLGKDMESDRY